MTDIHPTLTEHYMGMNEALKERDSLKAVNKNLENDIAIAEGMNKHLKEQLVAITSERNHYMRYSFALTTRINAMQDIWSGMMDLAKHEADNQLPVQLPKAANIEGSGE